MADYPTDLTAEGLQPFAQRALIFLHQQAPKHAKAHADANYMASWVKAEKARIKGMYGDVSNAAAEDKALVHPDYLRALEAARDAETTWYEIQMKREMAATTLEIWRTACSNARANAG